VASFLATLKRLYADKRFSFLSVLTLSVGIGLAVAIFCLVYGVLLAPLPYPEPERLVDVSHEAPGLDLDDMDISVPLYLRYRERVRSFEEIALVRDGRVSLTGLEVPDRVRQGTVTASLFRVSRTRPLLGRSFSEDEEKPGAPPVVLVSERFWRGRLGGDPAVLDRGLEVDGMRRQIVGVLPASFALPFEDVEVWIPFVFEPGRQPLGQFSYRSLARLREGASIEAARAEMRSITDHLLEEFPEESASPVLARSGFAPMVAPLLDVMVGDVRSALVVLSWAVGFVLLMACVNVANVFLVRAEGRRRELALRSALGASRARILAQFFAEGLVLALAGGALALALAQAAVQALVRFAPEGVPRLAQIQIDFRVLAFTLVLSIGAAVLVALLPTLPYSRPDVTAALREGGRGMSAGRDRIGLRRALVALQMALGLVLLVCSALMVRSFRELGAVSPGFRPEGALTLRVSLPGTSYETPKRVAAFVEALTERLGSLPGARSAGAVDWLPLTGSASGSGHSIEDFPLGEKDLPPVFIVNFADEGYLGALGLSLLEGRWLESADLREGRRVVVVTKTLARRYWPDGSAVGKRITPGRPGNDGWYEIVGVVDDVHLEALEADPRASTFYPMVGPDSGGIGTNVSLVIRTDADPDSLADAARAAVWAIDPNVPITHVLTLERIVEDSRAPMAFSMALLLLASALAVLLGAVGTYGVVSFVVSQRTKEIGVRMSLGALSGQVRRMVLGDGLRTALPGLVVGMAAAFGVTRFMASLLFGVSPLDPVSFTVAPILLLAVALMASFLPASRASRVNPIEALRQD
jgi:predicted permease